ncbi:MAG: AI-2E family transporter [Calothrix sp. MO_192.B10]|nr:AI-2E family transporter [Calothrix sp. MO_192.B10]
MSFQRRGVSLSDLLLIITTGLAVLLLWQLRSLLLSLMIAIILAAAISPVVGVAEKKLRLPRWLGVIVVYITIISGLIGMGLLIGPSVSEQIQRLARKLPIYLENLRATSEALALRMGVTQIESVERFFDIQGFINLVLRSSQRLLVRSFGLTFGIVGSVLNLIFAVVISGYMVAGSQTLINGLVNLFPQPWDTRLAEQVTPISRRMGGYIQGRVLVSGILGVAITLGLSILGLSEFALALGVIAGFTNLIPFIGPVLGAIPALIVAIPLGGWKFLWVLLLFVIIQNVETYLLDPLLVGSSVRVHPLYQLLAVLGGTQVLGIIGALIIPPWVAGIAVLLENLYLKPKLLAQAENSLISQKSKARSVASEAKQSQSQKKEP